MEGNGRKRKGSEVKGLLMKYTTRGEGDKKTYLMRLSNETCKRVCSLHGKFLRAESRVDVGVE